MPKLAGHDLLALQNIHLGFMVARCICLVHHVLCGLLIRLGLRLFCHTSWGGVILGLLLMLVLRRWIILLRRSLVLGRCLVLQFPNQLVFLLWRQYNCELDKKVQDRRSNLGTLLYVESQRGDNVLVWPIQFFMSSNLKATVFSTDYAAFTYWLLQGGAL